MLLVGLGLAEICGAQAPDSQFGIFTQEGVASWYGVEFGGRPTASGEIFTPSQLTAAHPTLPFGTMLKVTNKSNNRSVVVRVNDRGPFVSARIIDLSQGAAEQLDMITTGTAPVTVESLEAVALPKDNGRPFRPPAQEILSPPAAPVPRTSAASRPSSDLPLHSAVSGLVPPAPAPAPAPLSVPETPAPLVADAFTVDPLWASPLRQNQTPVEEIKEPALQDSAVYVPQAASQTAPVSPAKIIPAIPPADSGKSYRIQIGAYKVPRHAVDVFDKLKNAGLNPSYEQSGEVYRVVLFGVKAKDVESVAEKIGSAGFNEAVIREER